ncbi:MAG: trypsin-like serine protease [Verrucomicrobiota bacterium]|nr:trypsin-like serine protease [Verrucomicrobiota bacterium]
MNNRILAIFVGITFVVIVGGSSEAARRIGKLSDETWENHSAMAQNLQPFSDLLEYPDFSGVGALVSNDGVLGTASLVAPDVVITAAHVLKNSQSDPEPNPADWEFILYSDYQNSPSDLFFSVNRILIHPSWITRQNQKPPLGDGDSIGVDLALVFLSSKAIGVQPYSLPFANGEDLLGKIAFVSGFGSLINGSKPDGDDQNTKRMAGRNKIDRVVPQVSVPGLDSNESGGVFAFDFDSPDLDANTLSGDNDPIDQLGQGTSDAQPLVMEVSTAVGDSGGPVFAWTNGNWKIHGVISYGSYGKTGDSTYGDVTVLTRLETHLSWIEAQLPVWPSSQFLGVGNWLRSVWFGPFKPFSNGWNFHASLGWLYGSVKNESSIWLWRNHLGWLWFNSEVFPFCFSHSESGWLYLGLSSGFTDSIWYYSYRDKEWKAHLGTE